MREWLQKCQKSNAYPKMSKSPLTHQSVGGQQEEVWGRWGLAEERQEVQGDEEGAGWGSKYRGGWDGLGGEKGHWFIVSEEGWCIDPSIWEVDRNLLKAIRMSLAEIQDAINANTLTVHKWNSRIEELQAMVGGVADTIAW